MLWYHGILTNKNESCSYKVKRKTTNEPPTANSDILYYNLQGAQASSPSPSAGPGLIGHRGCPSGHASGPFPAALMMSAACVDCQNHNQEEPSWDLTNLLGHSIHSSLDMSARDHRHHARIDDSQIARSVHHKLFVNNPSQIPRQHAR